MRRTGIKRGRTGDKGRKNTKRIKTTSGALVTQARVFIPRAYGNPMAYRETKYFDSEREQTNIQTVAGATWASTGIDPTSVNTLFAPVAGTGFNQREGRQVWVKGFRLRGRILWGINTGSATPQLGDTIRVIVFMDKQTNGTQAGGQLVIQSGTATTDPTILEWQNPENFGRFKIFYDKTFAKGAAPLVITTTPNYSVGSPATRVFKVKKTFKRPIQVHFNAGVAGTVADIVDNSFHILAADDKSIGSNQIAYKCRFRFCE